MDSRIILSQDNRRVWLVKSVPNEQFHSPCLGEEFAALVAVYDSSVTDTRRSEISDALVKQGCRYGVCTGFDCSLWDDALDWAFLATAPDCNPPDECFVMTTWHENDSLEDTIFHFINLTSFDKFRPRNFVVLILGDGPEDEIITALYSELATE